MRLHTIANYQTTARYDFLSRVEADIPHAYADPVGIPTIGVGINLRVHGRLILQTLGFDLGGTVLCWGEAGSAENGRSVNQGLYPVYALRSESTLPKVMSIMVRRSK